MNIIKVMQKIIKIFTILTIISLVVYIILYMFSYHIKLNYKDIESIVLVDHNQRLECSTEEKIKKVVDKIQNINFYPSKTQEFGQSPISMISVKYKDGSILQIDVLLVDAMIYKLEADKKITEEVKFYIIRPLTIGSIINACK